MADFPLDKFRILYPTFAKVAADVVLAVADQALCFMSERGCECNDQLWMLMVAHLLQLREAAAGGNAGTGAVVSASIDKVSVSFAQPPASGSWGHWLGMTPWGAQFAALMARCSAGGFFVGGLPERAAFRSVGGVFPRGGRVW